MENKKQSSVDWLVDQLDNFLELYPSEWEKIIEIKKQAKAMHEEEQLECWNVAHQAGRFEGKGIAEENWQTFEQYYNEKFGGDNE